jgi:preprotein translocase subunit SecG
MNEVFVSVLRLSLEILLVIASLILTLLILLHKGRGGGLSDMFGGGTSSAMGSSGVAERNLNRFTIAIGVIWFTVIVILNLLTRFYPNVS